MRLARRAAGEGTITHAAAGGRLVEIDAAVSHPAVAAATRCSIALVGRVNMVRVVLFIGATVAVWLLAAASTSLAAPTSTAAVKPKPWQRSTAQAAAKVDGSSRFYEGIRSFGKSSCRGLGKQVARRYTSFTCTFSAQGRLSDPAVTKQAWLRVRPAGQGGACISLVGLAQINPACLTAKGLVEIAFPRPSDQVRIA